MLSIVIYLVHLDSYPRQQLLNRNQLKDNQPTADGVGLGQEGSLVGSWNGLLYHPTLRKFFLQGL